MAAKQSKFKGWWSKEDCNKNPKALFVFGDNDIEKGIGGQAVIRNCTNTIGIPTKKYPSLLQVYRKRNKLTQNEFARLLGKRISQTDVSNWETGVSFPQPKVIGKIEKILGISASNIFPKAMEGSK